MSRLEKIGRLFCGISTEEAISSGAKQVSEEKSVERLCAKMDQVK